MFLRIATEIATLALALHGSHDAPGPASQPPCSGARFALLDFWIGEWDVFVGSQLIGRNRIEKVLDGCAVIEHWSEQGVETGMSLFYYSPSSRHWRQVWVTTSATTLFGTKEKRLVWADSTSVRFAGELGPTDSLGTAVLDRTTLTSLGDGTVRQVIEASRNGGSTWAVTFDAIYKRKPQKEPFTTKDTGDTEAKRVVALPRVPQSRGCSPVFGSEARPCRNSIDPP